jgi:hypothetical protein
VCRWRQTLIGQEASSLFLPDQSEVVGGEGFLRLHIVDGPEGDGVIVLLDASPAPCYGVVVVPLAAQLFLFTWNSSTGCFLAVNTFWSQNRYILEEKAECSLCRIFSNTWNIFIHPDNDTISAQEKKIRQNWKLLKVF